MTQFRKEFGKVRKDSGLASEDHWYWCGSVVKGDDGRYHIFASRWSKRLGFWPHWVTNSEIVRGVSDTVEGPYRFEEVVLAPRGSEFWDGCMTHNPAVREHGGRYYLFYVGTTYQSDMPTPESPLPDMSHPVAVEARSGQRIGVAVADSLEGPWERFDEPILQPREGEWDSFMVTNPAPWISANGETLLIYKSTSRIDDLLRNGVAVAESPLGPYRRARQGQILDWEESGDHAEDPCIWRGPRGYEALLKDMKGGIGGVPSGGIHATSDDGIDWTVSSPAMAYDRRISWTDGTETEVGNLERPQVVLEAGEPRYIVFATTLSEKDFTESAHTQCIVVPLVDGLEKEPGNSRKVHS